MGYIVQGRLRVGHPNILDLEPALQSVQLSMEIADCAMDYGGELVSYPSAKSSET